MDDIRKEIDKLESDLAEVQMGCEEQLLGHPYSRKIYKACEDKLESLRSGIDQLEKEEIRKKSQELREEIDRLREDQSK